MARKKTSKLRRKKEQISSAVKNEIIGISIIGLACLGIVLFMSPGSSAAANVAVKGLKVVAGEGGAAIFAVLAAIGFSILGRNRKDLKMRISGFLLLWLVLEGFLHLSLGGGRSVELLEMGKKGLGGGLTGAGISIVLARLVGTTGGYVVLIVLALIASTMAINRPLFRTLAEIGHLIAAGLWTVSRQINDFILVLAGPAKEPGAPAEADRFFRINQEPAAKETEYLDINDRVFNDPNSNGGVMSNPALDDRIDSRVIDHQVPDPAGQFRTVAEKPKSTPISRKNEKNENFKLPPLNLVPKSPKRAQRSNKDIAETVKLLEDTLASFGVKVKVTRVTQGPAITRFELQPAPGVKVSKITSLSDDISLSLAASDVRIEAPIPGKSAVGIEVPNKEIALVNFREVLETEDFQSSQSKLSLALGKDIAGFPIIVDLLRMPHLLIAGATGSGKSVCINTLIASILYKSKPDEVKLLLIDPKMVELTIYNGIPHLISPVVTDPQKAAGALKWIVTEMETRYELFASVGVRDIVRYNFIVNEKNETELKSLPYVVVIIDELADLMMVAPGEVEESICRLAQMARAAGIHLIIATQRPSVDVITGLIKANIPSRIAFAVSSQIDSRTIMDAAGAEKLLGRGDMLYHPIGVNKPVRVQGCFLSDRDVKAIADYLIGQAKPEYFEIPETSLKAVQQEEPEDELFHKAANVFFESNTASVSLLQRRLRIGYSRAARIMDLLESKGVVGQPEGSKPREILLSKGQFEQKYGKIENA